jgi:heterodisulfide reductase subunit C
MSVNDAPVSTFLEEVLQTEGGSLVLQCYQCGTCSGSCPVIDEMEYGPRRIVYMIQAGLEEEVLTSRDMWRCVSCYSCANRCPRGIEITDLMADLRRLAVGKGYAHDKEAEFGQAFMQTVQVHGRLFEPELLVRYYARVLDLAGLLKMVPLGIRMLFKGKLPFLPERVSDPQEIAAMNVVDSTRLKIASGIRFSGDVAKGRRSAGTLMFSALGLAAGALLTLLAGLVVRGGKQGTVPDGCQVLQRLTGGRIG